MHPTVTAVIPCKDEADRIAETVRAVRGIDGVARVIVVDDGSSDDTATVAARAGAEVVRHTRNAGKAAALETGVRVARTSAGRHDVTGPSQAPGATGDPGAEAGPLLFVDGDLQDTAAHLGALVEPVLAGDADMTIATLPPQTTPGGGRGFVVRLARDGIRDLTGREMAQPLSGMRCLTDAAFTAASPLARGWGVEVGLTLDVLAAGLTVLEVPVDLQHRVSGRDWRGQLHRAAQYRDVWRALAVRRVRRARDRALARGRGLTGRGALAGSRALARRRGRD